MGKLNEMDTSAVVPRSRQTEKDASPFLCARQLDLASREKLRRSRNPARVDLLGRSWSVVVQFHGYANVDDQVAVWPSETSWLRSASRSPCAKWKRILTALPPRSHRWVIPGQSAALPKKHSAGALQGQPYPTHRFAPVDDRRDTRLG